VEVIEAARARGDWAALQRHVLAVLARERDLAATDALPSAEQVRAAADDFRYERKLLSADELHEWLSRRDISVDEWMAEMRRSLLEPTAGPSAQSVEAPERLYWVHAVCSGKLANYARMFAEEVAVHLTERPLTLTSDELAALPEERARFCAAQLQEPALIDEIGKNRMGWTRLDCLYFAHADEMVVREAALCVRLDGRELSDVARDAGAQVHEVSVLLDDAEELLRTQLLAAHPGDLVGPLATETDHRLVLVVGRAPPSLEDPAVRRRAEEAIITRALAAEVNRRVNWHEYL
jgi:hypothetical protein